ncbi:hypothetical protein [Blastochloris sulfoviridis]|uniref:Translation initiation factor IF-2 n=1 Tax=Blastochloris sulfoviridis TaxID=50712 RepID=A0A5M6HN62_9HYPH|nr:hypothetical protein [Blastochloris sulfoviridis]KAA5597294.1 hypothetical protein F1193_14255 [Blastochloris sulfoviridis]
MTRVLRAPLVTALVIAIAGLFGASSASVAQDTQNSSGHRAGASAPSQQKSRAVVAPRSGGKSDAMPRRAAPRNVAPRASGRSATVPRQAAPNQAKPYQAKPRQAKPRQAKPRQAAPGQATPSRQAKPREEAPRHATPSRQATPRNASRPARDLQGVSLRGAKRVAVGGRNYAIHRDSHRVRRSDGWRTFVGLSALGSVAIAAATYYPYAYIDAPARLCDGLTEDGCRLRWQEVPTIEGPAAYQCVAYCPWQ